MVSILIAIPEAEREFVIADLMDYRMRGCTDEPEGMRVFFDEEPANLPYPALEVRFEPDWSAPNDIDSEPILVGNRFVIGPPGTHVPGRLFLSMREGPAFGSGRHETTQMILEYLETAIKPGIAVADIGCGSGILSEAARLLGAETVVSCDIDPVFLYSLAEEQKRCTFVGSADALAAGSADVVIANITAKVLDRIAYDLNRIVRRDGIIIVSGFLEDQTPTLLDPEQVIRSGDWLCWICRSAPLESLPAPCPQVHSLEWY